VKRIAFVVQRCGSEVNGGSEKHCLDVARRLAPHADVEILTTCALDYWTWENHYPPGVGEVAGVRVRRFPVERPRDLAAFEKQSRRVQARLAAGALGHDEAEAWMRAQGPWSPGLLEHLRKHGADHDVYFFFTYLYATTYFGLPEVEERACLVPTAHDEWPIHMPIWERFFARPRALLFNTPEERAFLQRRFPGLALPGEVTGVGTDPPARLDPDAFRRRFGLEGPFLLYVGRIEPAKGTDVLLAHYARWRREREHAPPLVLIGRSPEPLPPQPGVRAVGFVDEQTKWDALAACHALVMPSPAESLSMVLLEAWTAGRPVLVNAGCDVLVAQTRRAQGGLWYGAPDEFAAALDRLLEPRIADALGRQGRRWVREQVSWERILAIYLRHAGLGG
jgi:glycosyltransferase involved in cell wall biosynthesis